jgi:hypothetical protein
LIATIAFARDWPGMAALFVRPEKHSNHEWTRMNTNADKGTSVLPAMRCCVQFLDSFVSIRVH